MIIFRLTRKKYSHELSGAGAAQSNNRWNSKGVEMIYCAESRALALAEVAVHLTLATMPSDYVMLEIEVPDSIKIDTLSSNNLPEGWNEFPPRYETQKLGDTFVHANKYCLMRVPSTVVQGDYNFLINTHHKDFKRLKIKGINVFPLDRRLFK